MSKEDLVTFRAQLNGTSECTSSCLNHSIETWVFKEQVITVNSFSMTVQNNNPNCIILPSWQDKTCFSKENPSNEEQNKVIIAVVPPIAASIIGVAVGFMLKNVGILLKKVCCKKSKYVTPSTDSTTYGANEKTSIQSSHKSPSDTDSLDDDDALSLVT